MLTKFEKGKKYKFSKEVYLNQGNNKYNYEHLRTDCTRWVDECDGKIIKITGIDEGIIYSNFNNYNYTIMANWCIEIKNNKKRVKNGVFIIQTNTIIDNEGNPKDFQSMVFPYESWEKYKNDLLYKNATCNVMLGTLQGCIKPRLSVIDNVIINDEKHVECIIYNGIVTFNAKAYKVDVKNLVDIVKIIKD